MRFGPQVCGMRGEATAREWLVADGLGGYAMGTVAGLRTRRYHGLLMTVGSHVGERRLGLVDLDCTIIVGDRPIRLSTHQWASGVTDPRGHELLESFDLDDGVPRWRWRIGGVVVERTVAMEHGDSCVAVTHRVLCAETPVRIEVTPLCTLRDGHGDRFAGADPDISVVEGGFVFEQAYRLSGPGWQPGGSWYRGVHLQAEAERGLGATEDVWAAGSFVADDQLDVVAWAGPDLGRQHPTAQAIIAQARARARSLTAEATDEADRQLHLAADQFIVSTPTGPGVVAGYPWFGEWSRDTMTSYEGLFLRTGRIDEGRQLLRRFAATLDEGMLANTADAGGLEYNTVDGTLWFVHAVDRHISETADVQLATELLASLIDIVAWHDRGTRFGIRTDPLDGLLTQGADGWALTWMDARVDGQVITPRQGKPVEVNALWVNALGVIAKLSEDAVWTRRHAAASASFIRRFGNGATAPLPDVVDGPGGDDCSLRPNQLLAVSLPYGPLAGGAPGVVTACREWLLTPLGLRSLSPNDVGYRRRHRGDSVARDEAYHQGTVWPWLIGPYVDAVRRSGDESEGVLDGLVGHLGECGLSSVTETADGDAPHGATGCPFQAWSVAEMLRVRRTRRSLD